MKDFNLKKYLAEGRLLKEAVKKVTKQMWDKMGDDAKINALLTAMSNPGQAEDAYELAWEDLPDEATQNMYLSESKLTEGYDAYDEIAQSEFEMDYEQLGPNEQEWVRDEYDNQPSGRYLNEDNFDSRFKDAMSGAGFSDDEQDNIMSRDAGSKFPADTSFGLSGYQKARDLIEKLRKDYRKMSDSDLEKFSKTMIDHFKGL